MFTIHDIDPGSPNYAEQVKAFYYKELESILFVLNESVEFIESGLDKPVDDLSNSAIGLNMLETLGRRVDCLLI